MKINSQSLENGIFKVITFVYFSVAVFMVSMAGLYIIGYDDIVNNITDQIRESVIGY